MTQRNAPPTTASMAIAHDTCAADQKGRKVGVAFIILWCSLVLVLAFVLVTIWSSQRGKSWQIDLVVADDFRGLLVLRLEQPKAINAAVSGDLIELDYRTSRVAEIKQGQEIFRHFVVRARTESGRPLMFKHAGSLVQSCDDVCIWSGGVGGVLLEGFVVGDRRDYDTLRLFVSSIPEYSFGVVPDDFIPPVEPSLLEQAYDSIDPDKKE